VAFAVGPDGQEWLGYDGGIARLDHGEWKIVVPAERLISVGPSDFSTAFQQTL